MPSAVDPRLLKLPQVCQRVGLSRTTIYQLVAAGTFPKPIKIRSTSLWATRLVDAWVEQQIAASER